MADTPESFARHLRGTPTAVRRLAGVAVRKAAFDTARDARTLAPVDTGNLRNSIGVTADTGWRGETLTATVGPTAHYGRYVEEGTSRMGPQPYMMPAADRQEPLFVAAIQSLGGQVL